VRQPARIVDGLEKRERPSSSCSQTAANSAARAIVTVGERFRQTHQFVALFPHAFAPEQLDNM